ncbi:Glycosyl hydrolase family 109 protein 1 precursor [Luteitalea pratensis]|uniref:Glycosyl hydrolase family 109 protein 1 n=1 Tax=Luteitalea pratensis TaxID=1855912 RepID=A0A143PF29_LUTPR|nr:Gfo/Idh/MocA family oxidoreductase [Luteitalea pratensis]AMY07137.1 Glycosyl hydrolase family 109 protein 1 precursor [Luteitalea pratensis]
MSDTRTPQPSGLPRRDFVRSVSLAAAGFTIVPRHVLGKGQTAPSDLVNVAGIGVGGMGRSNMTALASQNIVALCDVDWSYASKGFDGIPQQVTAAEKRLAEASPAPTPEQRMRAQNQIASMKMLGEKVGKATRFVDYREMLEKQKDIDAVVIATPDHTHAMIATAAMSLGKHVYVQKPLAWSVEECRALAKKAADNPKIVTQMGNQGHSTDDARLVNEYIQSGTIGDVREVHIWTNRPYAYWPQGIPRPAPAKSSSEPQRWNLGGVMDILAAGMEATPHPMPDKLAWDLFLGPAPLIDYHPVYHPFNWRGWTDWGVGAIGDMGAHLIDHAYWSLELGYPTTIETLSTPYNRASYPAATTTYYDFPARGAKPGVKLTWYDGGLLPAKPDELGAEEVDKGGGVLYVGSKGKLIHETYGAKPRLLGAAANAPKPPQTFKRIPTSHEMNWIDTIRGRQEASSPFSYAARLTEVMVLGVVALNAGKKIQYDAANLKIVNAPEAEQYLHRQWRQGWSLS